MDFMTVRGDAKCTISIFEEDAQLQVRQTIYYFKYKCHNQAFDALIKTRNHQYVFQTRNNKTG